MSRGDGRKQYGEVYVAVSRRHYDTITRAAEVLGTTRSGLVRELMLNPLGVVEALVRRIGELERSLREAGEALKELSPVVEALVSMDGAKFIVSVPREWDVLFERFVLSRGLEHSFRSYVCDFMFDYVDPGSIVIPMDVRRIDVRPGRVLVALANR